MKKILFISTRYPFPVWGGDKIRAFGILKFLSKKNKVDLICLSKQEQKARNQLTFCKNIKVFKISLIKRLIYTIISLLKNEPLQIGFYRSEEMKNYINKIHLNYRTIIFHTLRTCQYLPKNFKGKKILEMTDLLSLNYHQTSKELSNLNPLKYVYMLEKYLTQKYEENIKDLFDKFIFVSKRDIKNADTKLSTSKIFFIKNGCHTNKKLFKFSEKNYKILFIGNVKYLPNKYACYEFAEQILPKLNNLYPKIQFHIVGEINFYDKYNFKKYRNVIVHGRMKSITKIAKNSICGICNLKIATGFQNKIVNYMSYGIPTISSLISFRGLDLKKNKEIIVYKNEAELIKKIVEIKQNKTKANSLSLYAHRAIKNRYNWDKILFKYGKLV